MKEDRARSQDRKAKEIHPDTKAIIEHYQFQRLPVESTLYVSTYRSGVKTLEGGPLSTAMIGLYSDSPESLSLFHRLTADEVWHFYGGDPLKLVLLYPDGSSEDITMGNDFVKGQLVQFVVPAGVWQAGYMVPGGRYSLFGCTMAPGFTGSCFEAGTTDELLKKYPQRSEEIIRLSIRGIREKMPDGFSG